MDFLKKIIGEIECHSVDGIRTCFQNGISPNIIFRNKSLVYELITEYGRGTKFKECMKVFVEFGLEFEDKFLLSVLCDDAAELACYLDNYPQAIYKKYTLDCAFTQLYEVSLLHICAEYNHVSCAEVLVKFGADVNVKAGRDRYGFGGQTPIFHTVNQHDDKGKEMTDFLLSKSADLLVGVEGLIWGKGYPWETFIPSVNPISYAMMGLLPQFQRDEVQINMVIEKLMKAAYGTDYKPANVPNSYLKN
jgi:hypothetical protein